jgi:hypothetical protein
LKEAVKRVAAKGNAESVRGRDEKRDFHAACRLEQETAKILEAIVGKYNTNE